eukprot:11356777-Alexandrium_andersonii.AAC.1
MLSCAPPPPDMLKHVHICSRMPRHVQTWSSTAQSNRHDPVWSRMFRCISSGAHAPQCCPVMRPCASSASHPHPACTPAGRGLKA